MMKLFVIAVIGVKLTFVIVAVGVTLNLVHVVMMTSAQQTVAIQKQLNVSIKR